MCGFRSPCSRLWLVDFWVGCDEQTSNDGSAASTAHLGFDVSEAQMVERELERVSDTESTYGDSHLVSYTAPPPPPGSPLG